MWISSVELTFRIPATAFHRFHFFYQLGFQYSRTNRLTLRVTNKRELQANESYKQTRVTNKRELQANESYK